MTNIKFEICLQFYIHRTSLSFTLCVSESWAGLWRRSKKKTYRWWCEWFISLAFCSSFHSWFNHIFRGRLNKAYELMSDFWWSGFGLGKWKYVKWKCEKWERDKESWSERNEILWKASMQQLTARSLQTIFYEYQHWLTREVSMKN